MRPCPPPTFWKKKSTMKIQAIHSCTYKLQWLLPCPHLLSSIEEPSPHSVTDTHFSIAFQAPTCFSSLLHLPCSVFHELYVLRVCNVICWCVHTKWNDFYRLDLPLTVTFSEDFWLTYVVRYLDVYSHGFLSLSKFFFHDYPLLNIAQRFPELVYSLFVECKLNKSPQERPGHCLLNLTMGDGGSLSSPSCHAHRSWP